LLVPAHRRARLKALNLDRVNILHLHDPEYASDLREAHRLDDLRRDEAGAPAPPHCPSASTDPEATRDYKLG
jgi:hypothetical protein